MMNQKVIPIDIDSNIRPNIISPKEIRGSIFDKNGKEWNKQSLLYAQSFYRDPNPLVPLPLIQLQDGQKAVPIIVDRTNDRIYVPANSGLDFSDLY